MPTLCHIERGNLNPVIASELRERGNLNPVIASELRERGNLI